MEDQVRDAIEADDGEALSLLTIPDIIMANQNGRHAVKIRPFNYAVWLGALRCLRVMLEIKHYDVNSLDRHRFVALFFLNINQERVFQLLVAHGANLKYQTPPYRHSLLYHHCITKQNAHQCIRAGLLFGGARLNDLDKGTELDHNWQIENRDAVLETQHILDLRVAQCRRTCIALIQAMPGDRSCTRDWVRRFLWPMRHCQAWLPGKRVPYFLQREEEI